MLIILPHLIWLSDNEFITLFYGFKRAGGIGQFSDHFVFPTVFIIKQFIILSPVFLMTFFLLKKIKIKKITIDFKMIFLSFTFILPILLVILTSIVMGAKIRTMWMTPFYLLVGVFILHILRKNFNLKNYKRFFFIFTFLFVLSPSLYFTVSEINEFKRTDYPGKEIARLVQNKWDDNFSNEIKVVVGDEWYAGNLSYHLNSRPKWMIELKNKEKINSKEGVIYTGNPKILKKICPGIYGTIKPVGYCMIGRK